jgi:hypothetical protein
MSGRRTQMNDDLISRAAAIDAFMTATSDGDKAEWCRWVLKQLPSAQPEHSEGLYVDGYNDGYRDGMKDAQPNIEEEQPNIEEDEDIPMEYFENGGI